LFETKLSGRSIDKMPYLETVSGVNIHYDDLGEGQPLVLLHGWAGSGVLWRFQNGLSEDFRLIIPDLRGHGQSVPLHKPFTLEALVADLCNLLERLDLQRAVIAGWSLGSQVAMAAYVGLRERVAGLVLVGGTARFTLGEGYPHGHPANEIRGMGLRLKRHYEGTMGEFFRSMFVEGELSPEQEDRIAVEVLARGGLPEPAIAHAGLAILSATDLRMLLPEIDCPVMVIHGDKDSACPLGAGRYLAENLPNALLFELAGVGHAPPLSRPDQLNASLRAFLHEVLHGRD
jgi:pimeloyl-[acyl-carrier protein] methyl ester esterase